MYVAKLLTISIPQASRNKTKKPDLPHLWDICPKPLLEKLTNFET